MKDNIRGLSAAVLWTIATALMVGGTLKGSTVVMHWALFVTLMACIVTGWIVADCATYRERVRVDSIVRAVIDGLRNSEVDRIH